MRSKRLRQTILTVCLLLAGGTLCGCDTEARSPTGEWTATQVTAAGSGKSVGVQRMTVRFETNSAVVTTACGPLNFDMPKTDQGRVITSVRVGASTCSEESLRLQQGAVIAVVVPGPVTWSEAGEEAVLKTSNGEIALRRSR